MADIYTDNYEKEFVDVPSEKANNGEYGGSIRNYISTFTVRTAALPQQDDIMKICKLLPGSRVVACNISRQNNGATGYDAGAIELGFLDASAVADRANSQDDANGFLADFDHGDALHAGDGALMLVKLDDGGIVQAKVTTAFTEGSTNDAEGVTIIFSLLVADC